MMIPGSAGSTEPCSCHGLSRVFFKLFFTPAVTSVQSAGVKCRCPVFYTGTSDVPAFLGISQQPGTPEKT